MALPRRLLALFALLAALVIVIPQPGSGSLVQPQKAEAHRYHVSRYAEQQVYDRYNRLCGTVAPGWAWCHRRLVSLSSAPYGDHSWQVRYTWNEAKPGWLYGCGVLVQVYDHAAMSYTNLRGPSCAL